jgi:MoaA/NifB/PqqE/SkfB family radical SAM enzyme
MHKKPFSIVYQITQECPFNCEICHRYYKKDNPVLNQQERLHFINLLSARGLKRLAVTGGEPTLLGQELFDFLKYVHTKRIHTSLITTGFNLSEKIILEFDSYLDHLLISIRSLDPKSLAVDFNCSNRMSNKLLLDVRQLLEISKRCAFHLEVNTVVHKQNIQSIMELGNKLYKLNPNIIWRLDEYYPIGFRRELRYKYELAENEFNNLIMNVLEEFKNKFKKIRYLSCENRCQSREYFISQSGTLITTSNYVEQETKFNLLSETDFPSEFLNLRPWSAHMDVCRNFG